MPAIRLSRLSGALISSAVVTVLLVLCMNLPHFNVTAVALILILAIVGIAVNVGWTASLSAALTAGLGFDYWFLPPKSLLVDSAEDWVALSLFLFTAIITSWLFSQVAARRIEATKQRDEIERLYFLVNALLESGSSDSSLKQLADRLVQILNAKGVALYNKHTGQIARGGENGDIFPREVLRAAAVARCNPGFNQNSSLLIVIQDSGEVFGSIGIAGAALSPRLLDAITGRLAMGFARLSAAEKGREAELARRSGELKSAVLDALAHEIKNPLNSIKIAVATLAGASPINDVPEPAILGVIDEEVNRMSRCIDETLRFARADTGRFTLMKDTHDLASLVEDVLRELRTISGGRSIHSLVSTSLPRARCDREMIARVLKQVVGKCTQVFPQSLAPHNNRGAHREVHRRKRH
ncbi:MAG TPA: DUF4118 domain-containing protein [Bryobacteraceae bacterium]|nr:DUF4118 domain-containing protein [Bryobacteraceae bacterium]